MSIAADLIAPLVHEEAVMTEKTVWASIKADGDQIVEKLKALIHDGNVRRVRVTHDGRTVAEFPLTAGVVGVVLAPVLAAIGVLVAMAKDCTIEVERVEPPAARPKENPHAA
jgi:hypothetical protein